MSLNVVTLVGRAGRDPDMKYFDSGAVKCSFSLAVNRPRDEEPDWFQLECWGKTAEIAGKYVHKGKEIGIIGNLRFDHWQDKTTHASRSTPVIRVNELRLLGSKSDASGSSGAPDEPTF